MDKIHEVVPMDQQPELLQKLSEGNFTLRIMYEQFQNILKMGPIGQVSDIFHFIEVHLTVIVPKNPHSILCSFGNLICAKYLFGWFYLGLLHASWIQCRIDA